MFLPQEHLSVSLPGTDADVADDLRARFGLAELRYLGGCGVQVDVVDAGPLNLKAEASEAVPECANFPRINPD